MQGHVAGGERIESLDLVRGFAVCGILLMNIVAMGLPAYAYADPLFYGTRGPADRWAWGLNFVFSDGKMRLLFTMLFGASMVLIAERAEAAGQSAGEVHFRRLFWLFAFGMVHAWLIWFGDILVEYAVAGGFAFFFLRWRTGALWVISGAMTALNLAHFWEEYLATANAVRSIANDAAIAAQEIRLYRQGFEGAFQARAKMTVFFQTVVIPSSLPEVIGFMALGIIFLRNGFLAGAWSRARYRRTIALGYLVAAPLHLPLIWLLFRYDFAPWAGPATEAAGLFLRPFVALAHAAAIILLARTGAASWIVERLGAAGRMAFSNYIATSLITTTLFYGYGFGLFGALSRAELYWIVPGVWMLILGWSKPWLDRFHHGPLEWLWRALARGEWRPNRPAAPA